MTLNLLVADQGVVVRIHSGTLEQKIASLVAMRDSLRQLVATCDRAPSRRVCPLFGAMENDTDKGDTNE